MAISCLICYFVALGRIWSLGSVSLVYWSYYSALMYWMGWLEIMPKIWTFCQTTLFRDYFVHRVRCQVAPDWSVAPPDPSIYVLLHLDCWIWKLVVMSWYVRCTTDLFQCAKWFSSEKLRLCAMCSVHRCTPDWSSAQAFRNLGLETSSLCNRFSDPLDWSGAHRTCFSTPQRSLINPFWVFIFVSIWLPSPFMSVPIT